MLGPEFCIAIDYHSRLPTAKVFQLVAARTGLPMPRGPGVSEVVESKVRKLRLLTRGFPPGIRQLIPNGLTAICEANAGMLTNLFIQNCHSVTV